MRRVWGLRRFGTDTNFVLTKAKQKNASGWVRHLGGYAAEFRELWSGRGQNWAVDWRSFSLVEG
ncbi:hypothetical protein BDW68DRAFT_154783 [Aspergillus falconensis]